ncbi:MAG TPA: sugar ABC transporter permease [Bacillota bacterium]|nr:sugar ABC transporter permease [Bacillota bacterium]HNY68134.1 sugar ABC transporter permease [Bacillota bacterium]HOI37133.1 sugar ABC transporter permease [Bacillota bacterium]
MTSAGRGVARRRRGLTLQQRTSIWGVAFMAIPMLFFLLVRIYPALVAFNVSLHDWNIMSRSRPFIGLENYATMVADPEFWNAARNTLVYALIIVPASLALGLLIAYLIQSVNRVRGTYRMIYFLPYITPTVAVSWVWRWLFFKNGGAINQILIALGMRPQPFLESVHQALFCVASVVVWQGLGYYMVVFLAGLEMIPSELKEAATIDGANRWQVFRRITLPLLNPTIVFLAVLGTIRSLQIFTEIMNMTSGGGGQGDLGGPLGSTMSLVVYIYRVAFYQFRFGYASAMTVALFSVILLITLVQMKILNKPVEY